jgi:FtsZ-interacting cell division protein ZipA
MDEILSLLGRYWWLVGIVILRAVISNVNKKKKAESSSSEKRPERKSQLQEYLEKMRSEFAESEEPSRPLPREVAFSSDDEDDSDFLGHRPSPQEQHKQKVQQMQKAKERDKEKYTIVPETIPLQDIKGKSLPVTDVAKKSFPENLDYLPPMQRALIFSEIFGSPKGLDE